jgi:chromosome transmission fidelity protein 1
MDDYITQLFPYVDASRIKTLSCGHVIPDENLLAWPISTGPGSYELDFTFEKRSQPGTIDALGAAVLSLARLIPDGVVVFFPSYAYLDQVTQRWKTGLAKTWNALAAAKPVFTEAKGTSNVDDVLSAYSAAISEGRGALLLSVVGGKMSEGINFSDRLGRGVAVVGLPFPNAHSAEWQAKTRYLKDQALARGASEAEAGQAARSFYENACMRAVNQSIGRAIRHRGDYACIAMLDRRYATARIQDKLPGWIRKGLPKWPMKGFAEVEESIRHFFAQPRGS